MVTAIVINESNADKVYTESPEIHPSGNITSDWSPTLTNETVVMAYTDTAVAALFTSIATFRCAYHCVNFHSKVCCFSYWALWQLVASWSRAVRPTSIVLALSIKSQPTRILLLRRVNVCLEGAVELASLLKMSSSAILTNSWVLINVSMWLIPTLSPIFFF